MRKKDINQLLANSKQATGLKKTLGPIDLILLGIGAIVGTGIFVLTGTGAVIAGPALMLSFIIAAFACSLVALAYAEFSSSIPVTGSIYTYAYATMGELAAWSMGWILMLEYGLAISAVAVGWSGYAQSLLSGFGIALPKVLSSAPGSIDGVVTYINLPAFLIILAITGLLVVGIRESMRINNIMVVIKVSVVLLLILVGAFHVQPENWQPFMPMGLKGITSASAVIVFAFIGFDAVSSAAEEVKNPQRDLPIGIIGSLVVCAILYVGVAAVLTGITPYTSYIGVDHPTSLALQKAGQNWVAGFVDLGAILGMLTVMLVMTYGQTRILYAMSRDGLLPPSLSKISPRFSTPVIATVIVGGVFATIAGLVPLETLAELVNIGTLTAFIAVSVAVIVLRHTHPDLPRSFRCPGMPFLPLMSIVSCLFLISQLRKITWIAFGIWLFVGYIFYFGYSRKHSCLNPANKIR